MTDNKKREMVRGILRTYLLDDCLKPQYDGMTAWEIAGKIVEALWLAELQQEPDKDHDCYMDTHGYCPACDRLYEEAKNELTARENYKLAH